MHCLNIVSVNGIILKSELADCAYLLAVADAIAAELAKNQEAIDRLALNTFLYGSAQLAINSTASAPSG
jgi:hypothetical protein